MKEVYIISSIPSPIPYAPECIPFFSSGFSATMAWVVSIQEANLLYRYQLSYKKAKRADPLK
jgi:hypothetical protein